MMMVGYEAEGSESMIFFHAHHLYLSNMFPALPLIIESSQRFFESGDLSLHLKVDGSPFVCFSISSCELLQYLY